MITPNIIGQLLNIDTTFCCWDAQAVQEELLFLACIFNNQILL